MKLKFIQLLLLPMLPVLMVMLVACGGGSEPATAQPTPVPSATLDIEATERATVEDSPETMASVIEASFATTPSLEIECGNTTNQTTVAVSEGAGVWSQIRGDRALTGKSELIGSITCPRTLWTYDLAAQVSLIQLEFDAENSANLKLPGNGSYGDRWNAYKTFEVKGRMVDLDGDGSHTISPYENGRHRIGDLLINEPGYERIACDSATFQTGPGGNDPLPCYLQRWINSKWETVWISQPFSGFSGNMTTTGQPLVGDFDLDGEPETAVLPWYDVLILDLATGELEATGNYHPGKSDDDSTTGRPYGFFGAYDFGGDAKSEFLIMGDFEMFLSVLGWEGEHLVELWDYQIAKGIAQSTAVHDTGSAPVADIDGDGQPEIVTSIYNENGDQRWHVIAFDGMTGTIEIDLADRHLAGIADINNDGVAELLVTQTDGSTIPDYGPIEILSAMGEEDTVIWRSENSGFERLNLPTFPENVNSRASWDRRSIFLDDRGPGSNLVFATRTRSENDETITLNFLQVINGAPKQIASATGPHLRLKGTNPSTSDLLLLVESVVTSTGKSLATNGMSAVLVSSQRAQVEDGHKAAFGSLLTGTVIGPMSVDAQPLVVVQGFAETLFGLNVTPQTGAVEKAWSTTGRGMVSGADTIVPNAGFASVSLADIYGEGTYVVIAADKDDLGRAVLKAIGPDGNSVWQTQFDVPGDPPIWNIGGITHWTSGHFSSPEREDVLVSVRPTKMHSDQLHLLDGRTGEIIWTRETGGRYSGCDGPETGAGGAHFAIFDWNGDGLDDIVNTYSSLFAVYDGTDGSMLLNRWTDASCPHERGLFDPGFMKHPLPVAYSFLGGGTEQVLLAGIEAAIAVIDSQGELAWSTELWGGTPVRTMQGVGDFDGDGDVDIASVGHCASNGEEIQVFEAATGELRWSAPLDSVCKSKAVPTHLVTVDLDGDGRDEFLFTQNNVVLAYGESDGVGHEVWRVTFEKGTTLGTLAIADVYGSLEPQVVVNTSTGHVVGLGR